MKNYALVCSKNIPASLCSCNNLKFLLQKYHRSILSLFSFNQIGLFSPVLSKTVIDQLML